MNPQQLAERLCLANEVHRYTPGLKPCGEHTALARAIWGLVTDPKKKDEFDVVVLYRQQMLGKGK